MKRNLPVTQVERDYPDEERLVSETDLRGIITTANTAFARVAGYSEAELLGQSHNLVRHPDMPPAAFADLWRTIAAGERWVGVVKNRCKNGDHYWVKAFVSPVVQGGRIVRYRSVRKKPTREEIRAAEQLYPRLWAGEKGLLDTLGAARRSAGLGERLGLPGQLALAAGWPLLLALGLLAGALAGAPAWLLWTLAGAGALVTLLLAWLVHGWVSAPLGELARAMERFEQGDLGARAQIRGGSRLAETARGMNRALDGVELAIAEMGQMLGSLARGEFGRRIVATLPGELDRIKQAANRAAEQIESTVEALNAQVADLAAGNLQVRQGAAGASADGKFREAQENAAVASQRLAALLRELVASSQAMAAGDLTQPLRTEAAGELADLCRGFNAALQSLAETVVAMRTNARHVAHSTGEISGAVEEIAAGAGSQMATIEQIAAALRETEQTIAEIAAGTGTASAKSQETVSTVAAGRREVQRLVQVVSAIAEGSEQVSQITGVIEGIAKKTNLLALNAAIEAARAGQSGRGFAVVAVEVGKLAESSARSAKEIAALVQTAAVEARRASESVDAVAADMDRIEAAARESSGLLTATAGAMVQQREALADIGRYAEELTRIAQGNAAATEQLAASASEMARGAEEAYRKMEHFRVK